MTEESNKENNFFKNVLKSIKDLDKYEDFAVELPKKSFKYLLKLVMIFCIIICAFYTYQIVKNMNNIYDNLKNKLPDFKYSEGVLTLDSKEPIIFEEYKEVLGKIVIDTSLESNIDKYENDPEVAMLLLRDKCVILSNSGMGQVTYKYQDIAKSYNITEFTKQEATDYIESINIVSICSSIYFVMFIYLFLAYYISILLDVLLLSLLAYIVSRISNIKLKFAPSFNIAVHSITLPVILNLIYIIVNLFTGFEIKYFGLMYNTISYIYVIVAILMIKTDLINRQIELIKLAEEQEKIREELKQKEEEEKKNDKDKNKNPEKEDKEEKDKKEDTSKRKKQKDEEEGTGANAPACEELGK